jgi:predicted metal-binding protein
MPADKPHTLSVLCEVQRLSEMTQDHTLFVCTQCATVRVNDQPQGKSGGQALLDELNHLAETAQLPEQVSIRPVRCMFACEKSCMAAFSAAGKYTYLFAHLQPATAAPALIECLRHYALNPEGLLPYSIRPEPLKTAVLARIPPQLAALPAAESLAPVV